MLDQLPLDVLFHLTTHYLDFGTALSLSAATPSLRASLNPQTLCSRNAKASFYLGAEHFPQHAANLACFHCWRLLPSTQFADSQRSGPRGKFGHDTARKLNRVCWDCAVATKRYAHLKGVKRGGLTYYPCHVCKRWCGGITHAPVVRSGRRTQKSAIAYTICLGPRGRYQQQPVTRAEIEHLPNDVLERVLRLCDYADLIRLRKVNRFFRTKVDDPVRHCGSIFGMYTFTVTRWRESTTERSRLGAPDWSRPCLGCFRRREDRHFSKKQWQWSWRAQDHRCWRARCWECLRRFYHPQLGDKEALARFNRQQMCEWCDSLRYRDEPCEGCVVKADMVERRTRKRGERMESRREMDAFARTSDLVAWYGSVGVMEGNEAAVAEAEEGGDGEGDLVDLFGGLQWLEEEEGDGTFIF
ncbi:hypothetical protein QBC44DRAFT_295430 [Cladorrhinum sp. PSN332]|nr:hypothetical protein QBC44DRAFT_295430 [Cladorrhinum sp. PSN332]